MAIRVKTYIRKRGRCEISASSFIGKDSFVFHSRGMDDEVPYFVWGQSLLKTFRFQASGREDWKKWLKKIESVREVGVPSSVPFLPLFSGFWTFESIANWEPELLLKPKASWPDAELSIFRDGLVGERTGKDIYLFTRFLGEGSKREADKRLDELERKLDRASEKAKLIPSKKMKVIPFRCAPRERKKFKDSFLKIKNGIAEGDFFQCVLSLPLKVSLLKGQWERLSDQMRGENENPFFISYQVGPRSILSLTPERLIKVDQENTITTYPIAGTRPRGKTRSSDKANARALQRSVKEKAEHVMLVDLGRNDLGRVSVPGSVRVKELMKVHKLSRVQHLVSIVEGKLKKEVSSFSALQAAFPAGTLTGAPKIRAIEEIKKLEGAPRGPYGGVFVVADSKGQLDSCILIRSVFKDEPKKAWIQAGAGIVFDSKEASEFKEIEMKTQRLREVFGNSQ